MRADALGFFWEDRPVVKVVKEVIKRTPPDPVWLKPDYLPGLEDALAFRVPLMDDAELWQACQRRERLVYDCETYRNYFLCAFISVETGKVYFIEAAEGYPIDVNRLGWIMTNFTVVSFNGIGFDVPIIACALAGKTPSQIKDAANAIIQDEWRPSDVLKSMRVKKLKLNDHIDLMEVAPGGGGLKQYGGRLHVPRMQDLPFHHAAVLSPEQMAIVRWYCVNDLHQTCWLHGALKEQLKLREQMTDRYGVDLRSKSDAQIAEAVISHELERLNRAKPERPTIAVGTVYYYQTPSFLRFESPLMNWALEVVQRAQFIVAEHGSVEMPKEIAELKLPIADAVYQMGIGGLHSSEKKVAYTADEDTFLLDRDVTSYYPQIILNCELFPKHLGRNFLIVYGGIKDDRVAAKERGDKSTAETLKIVVNGSFGKLGSKWSIFYAPDLLVQVTLTGQLSLLMLVERLELRGFKVISANTDGVVIRCPKARYTEYAAIVKQWEQETGFPTEETRYSGYYGRDVNNYIAVKVPDKEGKVSTKAKGVYAPIGLAKNPTNTICMDAVEALLMKNVAVSDTIRKCTDLRKFVTVRNVSKGAVKNGEYLGATIRWYYSTDPGEGELVYAKTGNKVPRSDGAKPIMTLPTEFPADIDFEWYETEANRILRDIAYLQE